MTSPDMTQANIDKLARLFPSVVTETLGVDGSPKRAIDFDALRQELSDHIVDGPQERYQLDWPGKRAATFAANAPIAKTLRPKREDSVDFDTTKNLFIEGDNLDALKLLQESYLGKVKLIYIDPPYNTGNDFVYKDNFSETTAEYLKRSGQADDSGARLTANQNSSGRFHSDWLSMISARLRLARNLMTSDGLIFVSIDDNELHNLRSVMTEIFGAQSFVGIITRATGTPTGGGFDGLTNMLDYIVVFRRSSDAVLNGLEFGESDASIYNELDERGKYLTRSIRRTGGEDRREDRPTMYYGVTDPDGSVVFPLGPGGYESRWICGQARFAEMEREGLIEWKRVKGTDAWHPYQKFYLDGRQKRPSNLWNDLEGNKKGTREIRNLFGSDKVFDSPKPVALLERIIEIGSDSDSIVMDFFAGSATTAEAVMRTNARLSGSSRRYILVQLPEAVPADSAAARAGYTTISEISRERIRRAATQNLSEVTAGTGEHDLGFRALRVDSTNLTEVLNAPDETNQLELGTYESSIKPDRSGDDLLFQVLLDWGLEPGLSIQRDQLDGSEVFAVDNDGLIACFAESISPTVVRRIAERQPVRAVFRDDAFATDAERINAEQIFRELSPDTSVKVI